MAEIVNADNLRKFLKDHKKEIGACEKEAQMNLESMTAAGLTPEELTVAEGLLSSVSLMHQVDDETYELDTVQIERPEGLNDNDLERLLENFAAHSVLKSNPTVHPSFIEFSRGDATSVKEAIASIDKRIEHIIEIQESIIGESTRIQLSKMYHWFRSNKILFSRDYKPSTEPNVEDMAFMAAYLEVPEIYKTRPESFANDYNRLVSLLDERPERSAANKRKMEESAMGSSEIATSRRRMDDDASFALYEGISRASEMVRPRPSTSTQGAPAIEQMDTRPGVGEVSFLSSGSSSFFLRPSKLGASMPPPAAVPAVSTPSVEIYSASNPRDFSKEDLNINGVALASWEKAVRSKTAMEDKYEIQMATGQLEVVSMVKALRKACTSRFGNDKFWKRKEITSLL